LVAGCAGGTDGVRSHHAEVVRALGTQRPFVLRLSGGFAHGACADVDRATAGTARDGAEAGAEPLVAIRCARALPGSGSVGRLSQIGAGLRRALENDRDADALAASATLDLVLGDAQAPLDRALRGLLEAEQIGAAGPDILNDIAVALAARAERDDSPLDLLRALDYAERAAALDASFVEASFNRAALRQALFLMDVAGDAWSAFLELDARSAWAREAERRRDSARAAARRGPDAQIAGAEDVRALARASPRDLRERALDVMLAEWAAEHIAGRLTTAAERLALAREAGRALVDMAGDSSVLAAARAIEAGRADARDALAHGHAAYGRARAAYRRGAFEPAELDFREAERWLGVAPTPFRAWPRLHLAALHMYRGDMEQAGRLAAAVRDSVPPSQPSLAGLAQWVLGLNLARQGRWEAALPHYRAAERFFDRVGETENRGSARMLRMEALLLLGEESAGLRLGHGALRDLHPDRASVSLHNLLRVMGDHAQRRELRHAERAIRMEDARVAARTGRPIDVVEAASLLAGTESALGDDAAAAHELERARRGLGTVTDPVLRARLAIELAEAEAMSVAARDPRRAADRLAEVVAYFAEQRIAGRHATALARRSAVHGRLNDAPHAEADLDAALAIVQAQSAEMRDASLRASLLESTSAAFDALIGLQVDRGQPSLALETLERSRAAFAPTAPAGHARADRAPVPLHVLRARMNSAQAVLSYAVLDDRLLMWAITRDTVAFHSRAVASADVHGAVDRLGARTRGAGDRAVLRNAGELLSEWLLAPFAGVLRARRELVVIPDRGLQRVPFAALPLPGEDALLIERFTLRTVPGLARIAPGARPLAARPDEVLLVGVPEVDRSTFDDLPPLRAAARELDSLAALHPRAVVLRGGDATRRALLSALPSHELLHFAGHARFRPDAPDRSHLVLTRDSASGSSLLVPADLHGLDLRRLRLVVLSACSSLGASHSRVAGFDGLANAFISAGAGGVVGTLWEIEDERAADLVVDLHERLRRGEAPAEALRGAQLAALARGAAGWSAFRYEGQ
jgi:CHAT domain-containing protein